MPLVAFVMYRLKSADLAARLFDGEILALSLDNRDVAVGVAKRQLFVVAVLGATTPATLERVRDLREEVERTLAHASGGDMAPLGSSGTGGGGAGPAELPVVELGVSVRRERGKA